MKKKKYHIFSKYIGLKIKTLQIIRTRINCYIIVKQI